jgi:hypothetical protein
MTCEGAFAFFNDIIIPPYTYQGGIHNCIIELLEMYNENQSADKYIYPGNVEVDSYIEIVTEDYMTLYELIKQFIIDQYNGGFKISFHNGEMRLDFINTHTQNGQEISFGSNLLDFAKSFDYSDLCTVLIPLGPQDAETGEYMTIESVGTDGIYYEMDTMINRYGRYERVEHFSDAEDELDLLAKAEDYMTRIQYAELTLELSAIDLHYLNASEYSRFNLYDSVHCISNPHGVNDWYPISEMTINFIQPDQSKFVLGPFKEKRISGTINKMVNAAVDAKVPAEVSNQVSKLDWPEITDDIVDHKVIKAETMMATFCFTKYMLVQFMETNFEAIDASGENPQRTHSSRNYIRIFDEKIYFYEDELTDTIVGYEFMGEPLYWTAIDGERAFQYFTFESPKTINQDKRPSGITDAEFEAMYQVKVWATAQNGHHEKGYIGFGEFAGSGSTTIKEPVVKLGAGDGQGYGTATIYKSQNGLDIYYDSRTLHIPFGFRVKDDGYYAIIGSLERRIALPLLYGDAASAQADVGSIPAYSAAALIAPGYGGGS